MKMNRYSRPVIFCTTLLAVSFVSSVVAYARSQTVNGSPDAHTARVINFQETARLRLTHSRGPLHEAAGRASGTIRGRMYLRIDVKTTSEMSVSFSGVGGSSTLAGAGAGHYTISGNILRFRGTSTIVRGSGTYAHARGHGIRFEGTLNRVKGTIAMTISGQIRT